MKRLFSTTKYFIFFLFLDFSIQAQTPFLRRYTVDDGLPSSHVYRVFQDSEGFIWVCTDRGLARFDGYKFENFTTKNGLPYNDIWDIAEDNQKRLWLSSYAHSLIYFDLKSQKFEVFKIPNFSEASSGKITALVEVNPNKMIVLGATLGSTIYFFPKDKKIEKVLGTYENKYYSQLITKNSQPNAGYRIVADNNNYLIKRNPLQLKKNINSQFPLKSAIFFNEKKTVYYSENEIHKLVADKDSTIFIKDLSDFENDKIIRIDKVGGDKLIVFTSSETFIIDENFRRNRKFDFISSYKINSAYLDNAENLWICTKDRGLLLLTKEAQNSFVFDALGNYAIKCLTVDNLKNIWLGTDTGEVFIITENKVRKLNLSTKIVSPIRKILAVGSSVVIVFEAGQFAILPSNGRDFIINPTVLELAKSNNIKKENTFFVEKNPKNGNILSGLNIKDVYASDQDILFGSAIGIYKLTDNKNKYKVEVLERGIRGLAIANDTKNNIFIGSSNGLFLKHDKQDLANINKRHPMLNTIINDLEKDDNNNIWIATDGAGIFRLKDDKVLAISQLSNKIVKSLYYERNKKRIWAATNEGVYAISENKKKAFVVNKISLTQGLPTLEVHSVYAENDKLFAGTNNSLAVIDLKTFFEKKNMINDKIPLLVKSIKINGKDTTRLDNYDLSNKQNTIDIDFVALSYKSDKNIRYEYKLISENTGNSWQEINDTKKSFAFLSPGNYQFFLRAFDIEGNETVLLKPIIFKINPPFWRTWWFWLLLCLIGLGSIGLSMYLYRRRSEKEIETTKKFAELELQALQSQMNPHFVFNALSSIQSYILNQNTHAANEYLTNFSKLIRLFLESSRNRYIAISDEKVLIEKYIQLEQVRFRDKFTFQIKDLNFIEPTYEIPSMLIQPFVENAINHGLVYKESDGHLLVTFEEKNNELICIINDDGVGRAKAKELRTKSLKAYKSRATEIIDERLKTLKLVDGTNVDIKITDKNNHENTITGTIVEIKILMK